MNKNLIHYLALNSNLPFRSIVGYEIRLSKVGMGSVFYQDYVSYNLRAYVSNSKPPRTIAHCPMCLNDLDQSSMEPSRTVAKILNECAIPHHEYTHLFTCNTCNWWCIRELWTDLEYMGIGDDLITGVIKKWNTPWRKMSFAILREHFDSKRKLLSKQSVNIEVVKEIVSTHLKDTHQTCEIDYIGTANSGTEVFSDIFVIQDDDEWIVAMNRIPKEEKISLDAIDIANGVFLKDGYPVGLILTSTLTQLPMANTMAQKASKTYCVYWENNKATLMGRFIKKLKESTFEQSRLPWQKALDDEKIYDNRLRLPEEIGSAFRKT